VDLLYRNLEQVQGVIDESQRGHYEHDYYQQPTFGFVSVIYLAETRCCLPIFDPQHLVRNLKRQVEIYPAMLRQKMILDCLSVAEFTLLHAHGFAEREDLLNTVGCLSKIAFVLLFRRQRQSGSRCSICPPTAGFLQAAPGIAGDADAETGQPQVRHAADSGSVGRDSRSR
jgi:hypothetical protein